MLALVFENSLNTEKVLHETSALVSSFENSIALVQICDFAIPNALIQVNQLFLDELYVELLTRKPYSTNHEPVPVPLATSKRGESFKPEGGDGASIQSEGGGLVPDLSF